jgi:predicted component of type VI protein secretion system
LTVLDAPRDQAVARFNQRVGEPAFNGEIPTPGLVIWDYPYQNTPVDLAQLDELARVAAGLPVPVVFPLEAAFFGVKTPNLLKTLPNLSGLVDGWQFAKWRTLRDQRYSRCLVAVFGRFLLRAPHELRPEAREFTCAESAPSESSLFWAGGHVAFAVCAARSYATHGWPTRMFGAQAGKLADLPVVPNPADAQKPWGPGDATLPDRRLDEFPAIGINLLQGMPRTDHCILLGGVTVAKPVVTQQVGRQQATLEVSVPYQQFSNITGAWLCEQTPELHGVGEEEIKKRLLFGLRDLLRLSAEDSADAIMVGTGPAPDDPTRTIVQVRVTPPGRIVPGGLHVDFGFAVST